MCILRIGIEAPAVPIVSNENFVLLPPRNPSVVRTTTSPVAAVALWLCRRTATTGSCDAFSDGP